VSIKSIARRIAKLEGTTKTAANAYFPDNDGFISDDFRPEIDILFVTIYDDKDGNPSADQAPLKWRGKTFQRGEDYTKAMIDYQNDNSE